MTVPADARPNPLSLAVVGERVRIGYPCQNLGLKTVTRTFRLASYSEARAAEVLAANLDEARRMIAFNREHGLGLLRLSSNLVPFASHEVNTFRWGEVFASELAEIGRLAREADVRLSTHPGPFVLINSPRPEVVAASVAELDYQSELFDRIGAPDDVKIQIHIGGIYGDREAGMVRWIETYRTLPERVRARLVIENDERTFPLRDAVRLWEATGVPVLFDVFHHSLLNHGETVEEATRLAAATWGGPHGTAQMDYSSQDPAKRPGAHTPGIEEDDFRCFLHRLPVDADLMIEIKDKETSALKALAVAREMGRV